MIKVSIDELINQKVLLNDIFDADSAKIFSAGEIMTPGKIMVIRNYDELFKKGDDKGSSGKTDRTTKPESGDSKVQEPRKNFSINKYSIIEPSLQTELKACFGRVISTINEDDYEQAKSNVITLRDELINGLSGGNKHVEYSSELKLIDDELDCHALNTAIYSIYLANKMDYGENSISEVALGALLHDIGKTKIPEDALNNPNATRKERAVYETHTILGYKIIKQGMKLPTNVARIALEHHETMDGNGWPYGISNTMISDYAQLIAVTNTFDNISTEVPGAEQLKFSAALRSLLQKGSKIFSPKPLYTFVHMFGYSDNLTFKDLWN